MVAVVKGWVVFVMLAACDVKGTHVPADGGTTVEYSLGLTSRYADPVTALEGLSVWADGADVSVPGGIQHSVFADMDRAASTQIRLEVRYGDQLLDQMRSSPGDICVAERGQGNRLVVESVNLCLRANGELQLNDFSCEYKDSGYFTADVFCPSDCNPLAGSRKCGEDRCGLVMTSYRPRFGRVRCVPLGAIGEGEACVRGPLGEPDDCADSLACVEGQCRRFCRSNADCSSGSRCVSALRGEAEPLVCLDADAAPPAGAAEAP